MSCKGVIFDLDGTLLDTIDDIMDSVNCVLENNKYKVHTRGFYKKAVGDGLPTLVRRALPEGLDKKRMASLMEEVRVEYAKRLNGKTKPYDGIVELLQELKNLGIKIAVLSNKPDDATQYTVRYFFEGIEFDIVIGDNKKVPIKPSPEGVMYIAHKLGFDVDDFIYVGDTSTDMKTAVNAGIFPIGVLWGFREKEELVANGAKAIVSHPSEILQYVIE